jgi:hypothetical protein
MPCLERLPAVAGLLVALEPAPADRGRSAMGSTGSPRSGLLVASQEAVWQAILRSREIDRHVTAFLARSQASRGALISPVRSRLSV